MLSKDFINDVVVDDACVDVICHFSISFCCGFDLLLVMLLKMLLLLLCYWNCLFCCSKDEIVLVLYLLFFDMALLLPLLCSHELLLFYGCCRHWSLHNTSFAAVWGKFICCWLLFVCSFVRSLVRSYVRSFVCLLCLCLSVCLFVCVCIYIYMRWTAASGSTWPLPRKPVQGPRTGKNASFCRKEPFEWQFGAHRTAS